MSANNLRNSANVLRTLLLVIAVAAVSLSIIFAGDLHSQGSAGPSASSTRAQRFSHNGRTADEGSASFFDRQGRTGGTGNTGATEAPAGFDNLTNGFTPQGPPFEKLTSDNVV